MTINKIFFYTPDNNVSYENYVRKQGTDDPANPGVISGNADLSGKMSYAGYHTVTLINLVQISTRTTAGKSYFATKTTAPNANEWTDTARVQCENYSIYVIPIISYAGAASNTNNIIISRTFKIGIAGLAIALIFVTQKC